MMKNIKTPTEKINIRIKKKKHQIIDLKEALNEHLDDYDLNEIMSTIEMLKLQIKELRWCLRQIKINNKTK